jgi:hypothetical protein
MRMKASPIMGKRPRSSTDQLNALEERVADLERKLKTARSTTKKLEARVTTLENWTSNFVDELNNSLVAPIIQWGTDLDEQLKELDDAYRNLSTLAGANDTGPYERSTLKSCLGILVDRGGALPIDGNASAIFRGPIP